ncbi:DNA-binding domain of Mlu1-box binding protein MBP1 [Suhomyces tanzawaensis NRRL Y-17324]|uniref:DNA-binding domain of Mlu1-box binding protein MBP1 n=1 Tax=Suhomyces tanzawaensis NRRL Y-17324 TaxID=984487 RepID=A0A1E4SMC6_9ASCO|nr:DNA-binding domain of Mlu1-box binding protein MBP1 [Suhomyces tanzawaensis NRRL Y-17324]ODV80684.1 DNA-binding domain of Mlu1-box binding protein MBP1 [Suhomyces tanzawaensis NRRL Y-17324]
MPTPSQQNYLTKELVANSMDVLDPSNQSNPDICNHGEFGHIAASSSSFQARQKLYSMNDHLQIYQSTPVVFPSNASPTVRSSQTLNSLNVKTSQNQQLSAKTTNYLTEAPTPNNMNNTGLQAKVLQNQYVDFQGYDPHIFAEIANSNETGNQVQSKISAPRKMSSTSENRNSSTKSKSGNYPEPIKPKIATTFWEDEKTMCYQVRARGIMVSRRDDNGYVNGTKLLNVIGMTRGKRDGMLKGEKVRKVVKFGSMNLKGVWIPLDRAYEIARNEGIDSELYPLFVKDLKEYYDSVGHKLKDLGHNGELSSKLL